MKLKFELALVPYWPLRFNVGGAIFGLSRWVGRFKHVGGNDDSGAPTNLNKYAHLCCDAIMRSLRARELKFDLFLVYNTERVPI
jgi:hypothetical protein